MATPHVAGAIALALGCEASGTTPQDVVNALYSTAEDLGAPVATTCTATDSPARQPGCRGLQWHAAPVNHPPTAGLATSGSGMTVNVDGSTSSDPTVTRSRTRGPSATGAPLLAHASHTYTTIGTKPIGLR